MMPAPFLFAATVNIAAEAGKQGGRSRTVLLTPQNVAQLVIFIAAQ